DLDTADVKQHLRRRLPEYMVPQEVVVLAAMPLTPNGKIDRLALSTQRFGEVAQRADTPRSPPTTPAERLLADLVAELLGVERVSRDDNFFDLGGHSLLAMTLLAR